MNTLSNLVNNTLAIEKLRVASEVRQSHLARQERQDVETDELHRRLVELEEYVDGRIAELLKTHPAYPWFSRVKGIGRENIGKIVGLARVSPSDEFVCMEKACRARVVKTTPEEFPPLCPECGVRMSDPPYARTISGLWKYCGLDVQDGKAPKRTAGEKLSYNSQLRSMCWRVGSSLLRARGKFYEYYLDQKAGYENRYYSQGVAIVPATALPKVKGKKTEDGQHISEGHVHNQALRKTIKLFLACLWLTWREGEGLPVTTPYAIAVLGHQHLKTPEEMTDR